MTIDPAHILVEPDTTLLPDENPDLRQEVLDVLGKDFGAEWLAAKNIMLRNRSPEELIGTRDEIHVRDMLRSFLVGALS